MAKPTQRAGEIRSVSLDSGEMELIRHALAVQRGVWKDRKSTAWAELNEQGITECEVRIEEWERLLEKFR